MMRDAETVRLLQAVWDAVVVVKGYLGWLWLGSTASMVVAGLLLVNVGLTWWVVRTLNRWQNAGK